jgi:hypothetical protein
MSGFPALTPMYGLGSGNRIVAAAFLGSPRSQVGSARRIYTFLKQTKGEYYAAGYIRDVSGLGPFHIEGGRLVWN